MLRDPALTEGCRSGPLKLPPGVPGEALVALGRILEHTCGPQEVQGGIGRLAGALNLAILLYSEIRNRTRMPSLLGRKCSLVLINHSSTHNPFALPRPTLLRSGDSNSGVIAIATWTCSNDLLTLTWLTFKLTASNKSSSCAPSRGVSEEGVYIQFPAIQT